ncbi:Fur-regulated basic protein FbpA [Neobacillus sp. SM06]|uniref:Fur-regulated basic protein FbpA n=1 Tax=Neobacillus sp. SM06 TaxID=3422492 RepID=UPI003D296670
MRKHEEKKRQKLINKLIFLNVYNKEDHQLYKLPIAKLESEYRKFKLQNHPHGEFGSIQLV